MFSFSVNFFVVFLLYQLDGIFAASISIDLSEPPKYDVQTLHEGDSLEIKCSRFIDSKHQLRSGLNFDFPNPSDNGGRWNNRIYSQEKVLKRIDEVEANVYSENPKKYTYIFQRENVVHGDTGEYSCPDLYSGVPSTKIYISVQSNTSYFVEDIANPMPTFVLNRKSKDIGISMDEIFLFLSCQPTSLSYDVQVTKDDMPIKLSTDPVKNVALIMNPSAGTYKCEMRNNGNIIATKEYHVIEGYEDFVPIIEGDQVVNVTKNGEISINCTTVYDDSWKPIVSLDWTSNVTDTFTSRRIEQIHPTIANYRILINELKISLIGDGHMGDYNCELKHLNSSSHPIIRETKLLQLIVLPENRTDDVLIIEEIENFEKPKSDNPDYGFWDRSSIFQFILLFILLLILLVVFILILGRRGHRTYRPTAYKEENIEETSEEKKNSNSSEIL